MVYIYIYILKISQLAKKFCFGFSWAKSKMEALAGGLQTRTGTIRDVPAGLLIGAVAPRIEYKSL